MGLTVRALKGWLKGIIPARQKSFLKRRIRRQRLNNIRAREGHVSLDEFEAALLKLGLKESQTIFLHSSADWLRSVEGGAIQVLKVIQKILGVRGTLAMPAFPFEGLAIEYLETQTFDQRKTPSKMGLLTEFFRRMPEVRRSLHPTHSVCAIGRFSDYLTDGHHLDSRPFGENSPFARLEEKSASILMLGINTDFLTHVHVVEDRMGSDFPVQVYLPNVVQTSAYDLDGNSVSLDTLVHNPEVSRLKYISRYEGHWEKDGVLKRSKLGHIELRLLDAVSLTNHLITQAQRGITIYG